MEYHIWLYILLVSSLETAEISEAARIRREACPSRLAVLNYYHPTYDEEDDYSFDEEEDCSDPCDFNETLANPLEVLREKENCGKLHSQPCSEYERNYPYQTIDGSCNNFANPDWGMALSCHRRYLPHDYSDGVSYPRKSCLDGEDLPNTRKISNFLHRESTPTTENRYTLHFMEWGQFVAHDTSFSEVLRIPERGPESCCSPQARIDENCTAEKVPLGDDFYYNKRQCLSFQRTFPCLLCKGGVRQSLNKVTAYQDLSVVYGSNPERLHSLRKYKDGMLRTQNISGVGPLLPPVDALDLCESHSPTLQCFLAGDDRVNQNLLLLTVHTIMHLYHNVLCRKLKKVNPHWDDDCLFHVARRINTAQSQMITYSKYLEYALGPGLSNDPKFRLHVLPPRQFTRYDETVDGSTFDEFVAAAQRYGHTQITNTFLECDPVRGTNRSILGKDYFFYPFDFYKGQYDSISLGMAHQHPKRNSLTVSDAVRNYLYDKRKETLFHGTDIAAISIMRGREHGVPGYPYYLKYFFDYDVTSFCDLKPWIPKDNIDKLRSIYSSVHDVDLIVGLLSEYLVDDGIIGPTTAAMIVEQFWYWKSGDRFYFEHEGQAGSFTPDQLAEIKTKTLFSKIICETTKISYIQEDVFLPISSSNELKSCEELPDLNFDYWKEKGARKESKEKEEAKKKKETKKKTDKNKYYKSYKSDKDKYYKSDKDKYYKSHKDEYYKSFQTNYID